MRLTTVAVFVVSALTLVCFSTPAEAREKVKLELYVMSKCPYGVQAEEGILPVLKKLRRHIDFQLEFIVTEKAGRMTAMHGDDELLGNMQQLCARKLWPRRWATFLACQNESWRDIPEGWEECAKRARINRKRLRACFQGPRGKKLQRLSMLRARAANAVGSPTIRIDGQDYSGGRSELDFTRAICARFPDRKRSPAPCRKLPPEPRVSATSLSDKRCTNCDKRVAEVERIIKNRFFPRITITRVDYMSARGKKLYAELQLKYLPALLLSSNIETSSRFKQLKRWMSRKGPYYALGGLGLEHDPTREICTNRVDDTGDGKVDCDDPQCKQSLACRRNIPGKLDLFIMSQCPFGVRAVNSLKELLPHFGRKLRLEIHYVADRTASGFSALHGQPEVDENIRQLCAKKHYPKRNKYLDYLWCRYTGRAWRSEDWRPCATQGISAAVIERCWQGTEGAGLLEQDIRHAKALGISASPTWLANNRHKFGGISARQIWKGLCKHNQGLAGCKKEISGSASAEAEPRGGCGVPRGAASGGATPPSQAPPAKGKVGVPVCDGILEKYKTCVMKNVPEAAKPALLKALTRWRSAWQKLGQTPEGRKQLVASCVKLKANLKQAMASFKCNW